MIVYGYKFATFQSVILQKGMSETQPPLSYEFKEKL